jgi:ferrochelatase
MSRRIAIVLFNLGGPDGPDSVEPFLKNLFSDPAIIRVPGFLRGPLAGFIARRRAPKARETYAMMDAGGGSPLLPETKKQAAALEAEMSARHPSDEIRCFIAMRYWHPLVKEAARAVASWKPDAIVLLPLYPQFSTTTTGSSLAAWRAAGGAEAKTVCCYPFNDDFIAAHVEKIHEAHERAGKPDNVTLLLSAHGLPESIVKSGDPYAWQCEEVARRIQSQLPERWGTVLCYQSRVGPLKWIGPPTDGEVQRAAEAGQHILISPIAFVSEHIETLVELGEEYRHLAEAAGAASYTRVEALGLHEGFIRALADETDAALKLAPGGIRSCSGGRLCPKGFSQCPHKQAAHAV